MAVAYPRSDWVEDNLVFVDPEYEKEPYCDSAVIYEPDIFDAKITSYIIYVQEENRPGESWDGVFVPLAKACSWGNVQYDETGTIPPETQPWHPDNPLSIFHIQRNEAYRSLSYSYMLGLQQISGSVKFRVWFPNDPMLPPFYSVDISDIPYLFGEPTNQLISGKQRAFKFKVRPIAIDAPLGSGNDGTNSEESNSYAYDLEGPVFNGMVNDTNENIGTGGALVKWRHVNDRGYRNDPVSYIVRYCAGDYAGAPDTFEKQQLEEITIDSNNVIYMSPYYACYIFGLTPNQDYSYQVQAMDALENMCTNEESRVVYSFPAASYDSVAPHNNWGSPLEAVALVTSPGYVDLTIRNYVDGALLDGDPLTTMWYRVYDDSTSPPTLLATLPALDGAQPQYHEATVSLSPNTHYQLFVTAEDSSSNVSEPSNVVPVFTWDGNDSTPPYAWQLPMIDTTGMTTNRREVNISFYPPIDQSEMLVQVLYSTTEPVPGQLNDWIAECESSNRVIELPELITHTEQHGKQDVQVLVPEAGVEYYLLLAFNDQINPETTYDTEVLAGIGNVIRRIPVNITGSSSSNGSIEPMSFDTERCTGRWFDQDSAGNLAVLFTIGGRLCVGFYDLAMDAFITEEITCETEGAVFCDGRASLAFDCNDQIGVAYVSIEGFTPAPNISEGVTTSSVRDDRSVSTTSKVKYIHRDTPRLGFPGSVLWDDPIDVEQATASDLHLSFVEQTTTPFERVIPIVAGAFAMDEQASIIYRKHDTGDYFFPRGEYPDTYLNGMYLDATGQTRFLLSDRRVITGDDTGMNWSYLYSFIASSYSNTAYNTIGLFHYGADRDLVFFNGYDSNPQFPDVGVVQKLYTDVYSDFAGFMLPQYTLAGVTAYGTDITDLGLAFIGPMVEGRSTRDTVFYHVSGQDELGIQFDLPDGVFMQMSDYPLAVGYAEDQANTTVLLCYTNANGLILLSSGDPL